MIARILALVMALLAFSIAPASAQDGRWRRAESANFIVYGAMSEGALRRATESLENFDRTLRILTGAAATPAQTKLEVYLVSNLNELQRVNPRMGETVRGFYHAGAEQIAAFVIYNDQGGLDRGTVLFHEYAHHFMLHYFPDAYPRWYVEGWAEHVSSIEIRGTRVAVGLPSEHRGDWITYEGILPIEALLAPERVRNVDNFGGRFYANAWFAVIYLSNNPERRAGLDRYVEALGEGADPIEAFEPAFGITPEAFRRELLEFRRSRINVLNFNLPETTIEIAITRLPVAMNDLLLPLARLRNGAYQQSEIAGFAAEVQALAARHPSDVAARIAAARSALLLDDWQAARDQLDAALTIDAANTEARYLLARSHLKEGELNPERGVETLRVARRELVRGFRADPNHFPTLFAYASTFIQGYGPMSSENLDVLARSLELAPQADHIRLTVARELMVAREYDAAAAVLRPLLYAPHGGSSARYARALFDAARNDQPPPAFVFDDAELEAEAD
ncbi:tetratricopeptide repeat protein [Vitreimonas flagellata]|uniref:tetratricopeptide repeat protein n=1 Tax=Vitreimonas flagellata TaxID=2560861 RepID=UPI001074B530|nr:hypothetical protein [Vitreimonas flagellata]